MPGDLTLAGLEDIADRRVMRLVPMPWDRW